MSLWDTILGKINAAPQIYKKPVLDPSQVDKPDDPTPIAEGKAYCRLWLSEMRLSKGVEWFKDRYPLVYSATRYEYAGKQVVIPYVTQMDFFKELKAEGLDRVVQGVRPLTPIFPFTRNLVELQAGLFSMEASDPIARFINAMSRLSSMLSVPQLSSVISMVDPVYKGVEDLLGIGDNQFKLGFQQTFGPAGSGGSSLLRAGYFAVILADESKFEDDQLAVVKDSLCCRENPGDTIASAKALKGSDYMLFRLEARQQQDWEALTDISELVRKAQNAILAHKNDLAKRIMDAIRVQVVRSPDVVRDDREGMIARIEADLKLLGLQGASSNMRSLFAIMQQPMLPLDNAAQQEIQELQKAFAEATTPDA